MNISQRDFGVLDIMKIPFQCAPVLTCIIGVHTLLSGLAATMQVIVTSRFIDTAVSIVQDGIPMSRIYPSMFAVIGLIAYMWVSDELIKFAHVRLEIAARDKFRAHGMIVLDEPTAAIDPLEETRIYQKFAEMSRNKTSIIVTHRLGSAKIADRIVVMDRGQICEIGNHDELMRAGGKYAEMFQAQAQWYVSDYKLQNR